MMSNLFWRAVAQLITRTPLGAWLVTRAVKRPYTHITSQDGSTLYMGRWWLFNPYPASGAKKARGWGWLPSIRIHHIKRADHDRHHHDHPWNARTIVLAGWYTEERGNLLYQRKTGDTATLKHNEYHRITDVAPQGAVTLFITHRYAGEWGFLVDGQKIVWREYLKNTTST
jgi:hypothetical protein